MGKYLVCILLCIIQRFSVNGQELVSYNDGVIVSASSQFDDNDRFDIEHAVDKNPNTTADTCKCCAATNPELNPWYKVDLRQGYMIHRIHVLGRTDPRHYLYHMEIQLGTTESNGTILQGVDTSDTSLRELDFTLTSPQPARYITLTLRNITDYFVICELYIYADCMAGKYGPDCVNTCGNCKNNEPCDGVTGDCSACINGYQSPLCQDCISGYYGSTCEECGQCKNDDVCDKDNGNCPQGCLAGYQGTICKQECKDGTFGLGCAEKCENCFNGVPCNKVDGSCASCAAGYKGNTCLNKCHAGTYGFNCKQRCGMCLDGDVCDIYTGECPNGCTDEYRGSQCSQKINLDSDTCISLPVFIGSLFAVVVITVPIVIGLGWLCYRKRLNKETHKAANNKDTSLPLPNASSNYDTLRFENPAGESTRTPT